MRWQLNADALYRFGAPRAVLQPYLGASLGILRGSGNRGTDAGMNAIGGASWPWVRSGRLRRPASP